MKESFLKQYEYYANKSHLMSYEDKLKIWDYCRMDYGQGYEQPYAPYPAMEKVHRSLARFKVIACPNRAGKSLASTAEMVVKASKKEGGVRIWIVAEEYAIADNEWIYLEDMIFHTPFYDEYLIPEIERQMKEKGLKGRASTRVKKRETPSKKIIIDWPAGRKTIIEQKSFKDASKWKRLEGSSLDMLVFAEGTQVPKDLWDMHLKKRLMDHAGEVWIPATPKGEDDLMYQWFLKGLEKKLRVYIDHKRREVSHFFDTVEKNQCHVSVADTYIESYESFQFPGTECPYWNVDQYKADEEAMFNGELDEAVFRETNWGEFVSKKGKFFARVKEDIFIESSKYRISENAAYYEGVDIGSKSPSCCLTVAIEPPDSNGIEKWIICDEIYRPDTWIGTPGMEGYEKTLLGLIFANRKHFIQYTAVDRISANQSTPTGPKTIQQMMFDAGIDVVCPHMPRERLLWYTRMKNFLLSGKVLIYTDKCPKFCEEFRMAEYGDPTYRKGRKIINDVIDKTPDHALTAFMYLLHTNPFWVKPQKLIEKEFNDSRPAKGSLMDIWEREERKNRDPLLSRIGTF